MFHSVFHSWQGDSGNSAAWNGAAGTYRAVRAAYSLPWKARQVVSSSRELATAQMPSHLLQGPCRTVSTGSFYVPCSCLEMKLVKVIHSKNGASQLVKKPVRSCIIFLLPLHSLFPIIDTPSDSQRLLIKLKI